MQTRRPFRLLHHFLWIILGTTGISLTGGLVMAWLFEGDITVRAEGVIRPSVTHRVKAVIAGRIDSVCATAGQRVDAGDVLVLLAPDALRGRLRVVDDAMRQSRLRETHLRAQIQHEQAVLQALRAARRVDVEQAGLALKLVRKEQTLYSTRVRPGWSRRELDELVPVQQARAQLDAARAQLHMVDQQLVANDARYAELEVERQTWRQLDTERRSLWAQLEHTVVRAPVPGVVLTGDLRHRAGDHVQTGDALLELAEGDRWGLRLQVQQIDRPRVVEGQAARVFVHAYPHLEHGILTGYVQRVGQQAAHGAPYPVDIELDRVDLALADGMAAEARVSVDSGRLLALAWRRLLREFGRLPALTLRPVEG